MSQESKYQRNIQGEPEHQAYNNLATNSLDFRKMLILLKKSIFWILLFIFLSIIGAVAFIRYTNVKYKSNAELKLNKRNEASVFGFPTVNEENINSLSGEVELIRSKLFLKEVARKLPLNIKYELVGRFKNEERYKFIPFKLTHQSCSNSDHTIYIEIIDEISFRIANNLEFEDWGKGQFGEPITFNDCQYLLNKTNLFFSSQTIKVTIQNNEAIVNYLSDNLEVAPENYSANTIKIAFTDYNPYKVQDIVKTVSELYTNFSREQKNQANELKINFLNTQLREIEEIISNYETYIEDFTLKNKTANPSKDLVAVLNQIIQIDSSIYQLKRQSESVNKLNSLLSQDSIPLFLAGNAVAGSTKLAKLLEEYSNLKTELKLLNKRYKQKSLIIYDAEQRLDILKTEIDEIVNAQIENIEDQVNIAIERKASLITSFSKLPGKSNELNQKMRFYSIYEELYLSLMQKKTEFQIAKAGTLAEVVILKPAEFANVPIGPSTKIIYLAAFLIGTFLSLIFIVTRYFIYDEINSFSELERLTNISITGSINRVRKSVAKKTGVLVFDKPRAQISENFRTIRTGLNFMGIDHEKQVIAVTSSISGEGKTFIAVNLAAVLSLSKKKTIILDLDMRKPRAQYAFNIEKNDTGMSSILSGNATWKDCIHITENENLHLITSGVIPPNPAELLESRYFKALLVELKQEYDVIILDTPPIGLVSDGITALKEANHSLFIVRSDYSKRGFIKDLHRNVKLNGLKNISIVFNAARNSKKGYGYYQDYYDDNMSKSNFSLTKIFNLG